MGRIDYFDDENAPVAQGRVPGVVAAVRDDVGRLLLVRRCDNGWWAMPGGKLELGETIAEAAVRETLEETGIDIEVTGFAGIYTDPGHIVVVDIDPGDRVVLQEFTVCLHGRHLAGTPRPDNRETSDVRWFTPSEIDDLPLHPAARKRITDALTKPSPTIA
ncbi:NUDIX domain-containing protein [Nocardia sp. NPDC050713]|uniref:NUDIX hydrolase n=1 Tax=Nocardia sp. NPDC050713 TaxID=3154511 RepID=UPI003408F775